MNPTKLNASRRWIADYRVAPSIGRHAWRANGSGSDDTNIALSTHTGRLFADANYAAVAS